MKKIRKFAFLTIIAVFMLSSGIPLRADDTVLFTANVAPDALIMMDLSGSMGQNPGGEYNYQASWIGDPDDECTDAVTWSVSGAGHTYRCASVSGQIWADSACNGPFYTWRGGTHSTDCSKLAIAKRALFDLLDENDDGKLQKADEDMLNVRFGYMRFYNCQVEDSSVDYNSGCNTLRRGFGFDYNTLYNNYISADTNLAWTALASQLKEGKKYLDDHKSGDPAAECRKKFLILVTDGWDTVACGGDRNAENEYVTRSFGYKRRKATVAAVKEAIDAGYTVFGVGFGADMPLTERNTLNWVALKGGTDNLLAENSGDPNAITFSADPCQEYAGCSPNQAGCTNAPNDPGYANLSGYAFLAQDATTLGESLQTIIRWVKEKSFTFTAPTVPSVRLMDSERAYISSLTPNVTPFWRGDLRAYTLNQDGTLPVDASGFPSNQPEWEAQTILKTTHPDSRKIYTYKTGVGRVLFTDGNITAGDLSVSTETERQELIKHVRGFDPWDTDQDGNTADTRDFKLADIFHSQAVIVGAPSKFFVDEGYNASGGFYNAKKDRTKVILAGANDGMLHAFDAGTGAERWAFIPPSLLTSLKTMKTRWDTYIASGSSGVHLYYVDGSPRVSDVWFYDTATDTTKSESEWRTVLISGLRKGGKTYFALDITDTTSPQYLWEFPTDAPTLSKIGDSWSDPAIGRIRIEVSGTLVERWVAFIGGGHMPDPDVAEGRYVFVVDIKTGAVLKEFSGFVAPMAAPITIVDTDNNGYVDRFYAGDEEGRMFVGYIGDKDPANWTTATLFVAPGAESDKHPIHYAPAVAFDSKGTPWVFFGTGPREDPLRSTKERFYAIKDNRLGSYPRVFDTDLVDVSTNPTTYTPIPDDKYGWHIFLPNWGEKVYGKPAVFNGLVYFTTYSPTEYDTDVCTVGGSARLYVAEFLSGAGALAVDDMGDLSGTPGERSKVIGSGVPSSPVVSINSQGQATIIIGTTEGQVYSQPGFSPDTNKQVIYWREIFY
jgi:hypothetical protein